MTTGQIMMRLREIEAELDKVRRLPKDADHLERAEAYLSLLIEQMLADDRRHAEARTMGELPFDGGERVKP